MPREPNMECLRVHEICQIVHNVRQRYGVDLMDALSAIDVTCTGQPRAKRTIAAYTAAPQVSRLRLLSDPF